MEKTTSEISSRRNKELALHTLLEADIAPEELRASLIHSITSFERSFRKQFPIIWASTLVGPVLVTIALLFTIAVFNDWQTSLNFLYASFWTFFIFGRFIILIGQDGQAASEATNWITEMGLTPGQLFGMLTYMDVLVALFVTFHMGVLFRLPWLGNKIAGLASDGKFIMDQQPWLRRLAFFALIGFVIFPTSTTGSIGGSIFGRLLGLGRFRTVLGVVIGSLLGNSLMYFFAREINDWVGPDSFWIKLTGVLLLVVAVMFVEWRYRQAKNKYLVDLEERRAASQKK